MKKAQKTTKAKTKADAKARVERASRTVTTKSPKAKPTQAVLPGVDLKKANMLTGPEVQTLLGAGKEVVSRWKHEGKLTPVSTNPNKGGGFLYSKPDVMEFKKARDKRIKERAAAIARNEKAKKELSKKQRKLPLKAAKPPARKSA
jgi:hypothetical protein